MDEDLETIIDNLVAKIVTVPPVEIAEHRSSLAILVSETVLQFSGNPEAAAEAVARFHGRIDEHLYRRAN